MPLKPKSTISVNSSVLSTSSVNVINANNVTVTGSITTPSISTDQLVVNGHDVTSVFQTGGNLNSNSANISGTLTADDVITNSVGISLVTGIIQPSPAELTIQLNELYSPVQIANTLSQIGFICVTLLDDSDSTGAIGLYTRAKMFTFDVYSVLMEKNNNNNLIASLDTTTGLLTIKTMSTTNSLSFEVKALNLFDK
jgi:hypothetical protein